MIDLSSLPHHKQIIQLRMCLSQDIQKLLQHTLGVSHDTQLTVDEVLDLLQDHFKSQRNQALRRRDFLTCKQKESETFDDFYLRLRDSAEQVDICVANSLQCEETQLKMVLLMGVREEELQQKILSLDSNASLQDVVTLCRVHEATKTTTSAIRTNSVTVGAVSQYRKNKGRGRQSDIKSGTNGQSCPFCNKHHSSRTCPAAQSTCHNCGRKGHWAKAPKCPALNVTCRHCNKRGHLDKCCRSRTGTSQGGTPDATCSSQVRKVKHPILTASSSTTVPVTLCHKKKSYTLHFVPDTGADISIVGPQHLASINIDRSDLLPPTIDKTYTADGTLMTPSLGSFEATMSLGKKSCNARIQVHSGVETPLLSFSHCKELAIISSKFPKPILHVTHVNRCSTLPLTSETTPAAAREYFISQFPDVLVSKSDRQTVPLQTMIGAPMRIHLRPDATPFALNTPRQIPYAYREAVKSELQSMVDQGIIKPCGDEPSQWCHPMVVVPKPNGVRITIDLTKLNHQVSRPVHSSMTPLAAVRTVDSSAKFFTTADALHGYWQVELAEEDRHLTTFITPYGRYYYCRGPMGFAATGDAYCYRGDLALQGVQKCVKVVDDILLFDEDLQQHYTRIQELLTRCRSHGITLNKDKFTVAASSVNFCGYTLSREGISADPDRVSALRDFPKPANITDLRSFLGLVNQLAEFTPEIAATAQPLRPLLSPKSSFTWTPDHDLAFTKVKEALSSPPILAPFDPALPTYLQTDASRLHGVGYALLQDHGAGHLRLVQCGSRFLSDPETRYATIELEMLAVSWALKKCRLYLTGLPSFTIHTDHRPLVPILNSYTLDMIENPRLQRLRERMSHYMFSAVWRAGRSLRIPDAFSRAPVSKPTEEDTSDSAFTTAYVRSVVTSAASQDDDAASRTDADRRLQDFTTAARQDQDYARLRDTVVAGFPSHRYSLHPSLLPYWKVRDSLSVDDSLVLLGARVVVPVALRRQTLARLHDSHRGVEATKRRARQTVFWPGLDSDIASTVSACEPCQVIRPSQQQEPLLHDDTPTRPFESVSADFCQVAGKHFLVIVDRLSNWPAVVPCKGDTSASSTIRYFCTYFREVGVPLRLRTDGGPPFQSSEFADFTKRWGIHHITSSPAYPQSNGHAEAAVKAIKRLILTTAPSGNINCEDFDRGLMEIRNTPNPTGRSPAQVLYGRPLRSCMPAHPDSFTDAWQSLAEDCDRRAASRAATVQEQYNQHAKNLPKLPMGQHVRVQDPVSRRWDRVGVVMGGARAREYEVRLPSGRVLRRNRRYLFPVPTPGQDVTPHLPVLPLQDIEKSKSLPSPAPRRSPRQHKS